jgi:hypothetical protein
MRLVLRRVTPAGRPGEVCVSAPGWSPYRSKRELASRLKIEFLDQTAIHAAPAAAEALRSRKRVDRRPDRPYCRRLEGLDHSQQTRIPNTSIDIGYILGVLGAGLVVLRWMARSRLQFDLRGGLEGIAMPRSPPRVDSMALTSMPTISWRRSSRVVSTLGRHRRGREASGSPSNEHVRCFVS